MPRRTRREIRVLLQQATNCARLMRATHVEAEHLLLALATYPATVSYAVLSHAGLTEERIVEALERERGESLSSVGVTVPPPPGLVSPHVHGLGESARLALVRGTHAARVRRDRSIRNGHVLLGVLAADVGRVPRALALAGVDRLALRAEAAAAMDSFSSGDRPRRSSARRSPVSGLRRRRLRRLAARLDC
jgi:ATP-dependent Clp protease ATP-binding subunit ClpA